MAAAEECIVPVCGRDECRYWVAEARDGRGACLHAIQREHPGEWTLEEVGDIFGLTRERIRQIEAKALGKLPKTIVARGLGLADFEGYQGEHPGTPLARVQSGPGEVLSTSGLGVRVEQVRIEAPPVRIVPVEELVRRPAQPDRRPRSLPRSLESMAERLGVQVECLAPSLPAATPAREPEPVATTEPPEPCEAPGADKREIEREETPMEPRVEELFTKLNRLAEVKADIARTERALADLLDEQTQLAEWARGAPEITALLEVLEVDPGRLRMNEAISIGQDTAHIGPFTCVRACLDCGVLISGGPTRCLPCVAKCVDQGEPEGSSQEAPIEEVEPEEAAKPLDVAGELANGARSKRGRILAVLREHGPLKANEVADRADVSWRSISAHLSAAKHAGLCVNEKGLWRVTP
jgi:DNA-binding transcriptional ArsR family regulator